jgi:hypothetical protein
MVNQSDAANFAASIKPRPRFSSSSGDHDARRNIDGCIPECYGSFLVNFP